MTFRRLLFPLLGALFGWFVWRNAGQASELWRVLHGAKPLPLAVALIFQLGTLANQPAFFQSLYALVGIEAQGRDLAPVVLAGRFVNVVAPAAGLGETALLFEQAKRRGWDLGRVSLVVTLYFALNFAVFALILGLGLGLLAARGALHSAQVMATLPILLGLALGVWALGQIAKNPDWLADRAQKLATRVPRRLQKWLPDANAARDGALSFSTSLRALLGARGQLARPVIHAVLVDALEIAVLAACLSAVGVAVSPALLMVSYTVGTLFTVVSITPQGVGAVEGALGATLVSFGISLPHAMAVVLLYRGLSFWLPLSVGFAATRWWTKSLSEGVRATAALHRAV